MRRGDATLQCFNQLAFPFSLLPSPHLSPVLLTFPFFSSIDPSSLVHGARICMLFFSLRLISCSGVSEVCARFGLVCSLAGGDNEREHAGAAVTVSRSAAAYLRAFSRCHCHTYMPHVCALVRIHKLLLSVSLFPMIQGGNVRFDYIPQHRITHQP